MNISNTKANYKLSFLPEVSIKWAMKHRIIAITKTRVNILMKFLKNILLNDAGSVGN